MLPTLSELKENFALFDDWESRYGYLIDLGQALPGVDAAEQTPAHLVPGCTSQVWLVVDVPPTATTPLAARATSDALIVKGLLAVLLILFNDKKAPEIAQVEAAAAFEELGLAGHLSPNRRNGFFAIAAQLQKLGEA